MAHSPKPGGTRRGVVQPPNQSGPGGNRANNSYLPLGGSAHPGTPPHHDGGDRRSGCVPLGKMASPVHLPDHRFDVDTAKMPQPPSAVELGRGAIPVTPWDAAGRPNHVTAETDLPKEPRR
jgi:hypothetical protein